MLLPLAYVPYASRIIGPDNFGAVEYVINFVVYFTTIINYGFYYSATKKVSSVRNNDRLLREVVADTLATKVTLGIIISVVYLILIFSFDFFEERRDLFLLAFFSLFGAMLTPWFLLQGLEKFKMVGVLSFSMKLSALIIVFVFLQTREDYYLLIIVNSVPEVIIGIFSLILFRQYNFNLNWSRIEKVGQVLKNNFYVFANEYAVLLLVNSIVLLMGTSLGETELGNYTAAYKFISITQIILIATFVKASFPNLSMVYERDRAEFKLKYFRVITIFLLVMLIVSSSIYALSEHLIIWVFGRRFEGAIEILKSLSFLPFFMGCSASFGWIGLLILNRQRQLFLTNILLGVITVSVLLLFGENLGIIGFTYFRLIGEIILAVILLSFLIFNLKKSIHE